MRSVRVSRIRPGRRTGDGVELLEKAAHDFIAIGRRAQPIELRQHFRERPLDLADGTVRIVLTLRIEAPLALDELFSIEVWQRVEDGICVGARIGQETCNPVP